MIYNDFPILTETNYKTMQEEFNSTNNFSRQQHANSICNLLNQLIVNKLFTSLKINSNVKNILIENNQKLIKIYNNFCSIFSITNKQIETINNLNIFKYINSISTINQNLTCWLISEKKEAYKNILLSTKCELEEILTNTSLCLEKCNFYFCKYM